MKILGPDHFIFAVDDIDACAAYLDDYGLNKVERSATGAIYECQDGTGLILRTPSDTSLPNATAPDPNIREIRYGVDNKATLESIAAELSKDRDVKQLADGVLRSTDDDGYHISFQVTVRRPYDPPYMPINVPGKPGRPLNATGIHGIGPGEPPKACTLSHAVMFTGDKVRAANFYTQRLGFRVTDEFTDLGPFMRPEGNNDHHCLFLIQAPPRGIQHFTCHFASVTEQLRAGWQFVNKGYKSFWGPGRHVFGSNYFWYFHSPFGGLMEFDADMDRHDDSWVPRRHPGTEDGSQAFLLQYADKWVPRGG